MKKFLLLLGVFCFSFSAYSQTTIAFQGFEGDAGDTWTFTENPAAYDVSGDVWAVQSASLGGITAATGNNFWGMQDLENPNGGGAFDHTLTFPNQSVSGFNNVILSFKYDTRGLDGPDYLRYEVFLDNVGQGQIDLNKNSQGFLTVTENIPAGTTNVSLVLIGRINGGSDYAGWDDISLTGNVASGDPLVGFVLAASSADEGDDGTTTTLPVQVRMDSAPSNTVTVTVTSADGTATVADNDYQTVNETLTFNPGDTYPNTQSFNVLINGDDVVESNEDFTLNLTASAGADEGINTHTVTITNDDFPPLVINEILADPDGSTGDANNDGTVSTTEDEFVEIYNTGTAAIDISGFSISDAVSTRHTFAANTILAGGDNIVVFGGGTPVQGFAASTFVTASSGALSLNNSGDNITLSDAGGTPITTVSYGGEGGNNQSLARDPDFTGAFVQHSNIGTNPVDFSPGELNSPALPVELTDFLVEATTRTTVLTWSTALEINNSHFEVQHSADNRNFVTLNKVAGAGNSDAITDYRYVHENPTAGMNFYRLLQIDFDGQSEYSRVVSVFFGKENGGTTVHPNPVNSSMTVTLDGEFAADALAEVISQNGAVVLTRALAEKSSSQTVDTADLPAGIYTLRITNGNRVYTKRFVKN